MGALTLNLPYSYRSWETEVFPSFDPTNGFAQNTKIFLKNNFIASIEPENKEENNWITNKARLFFDTIHQQKNNKNFSYENETKYQLYIWNFLNSKKENDTQLTLNLFLSKVNNYIYLSKLFNFKKIKSHFNKNFTIIFETISIETICLLNLVTNCFSFISIKRALDIKNINNDLESNFQLPINKTNNRLNYANLGLLLGIDSSSDGNTLDIYLRQRAIKGNFDCYSIGSLVNFILPTTFLGSSLKTIKPISNGTHVVCQKVKKAIATFFNVNLTNRKDFISINESIKLLKYSNEIFKKFTDINFFLFSLYETGIQSISSKFQPILHNDLVNNLNLIYLLNVNSEIKNLKYIILNNELNYEKYKKDSSLLNVSLEKSYLKNTDFLNLFNADFLKKFNIKNSKIFNKLLNKTLHFFSPTQHFFSSDLTLINVEGLIKRATKINKEKFELFETEISFVYNFFKTIKKQLNYLFVNTNEIFLNFKNMYSFKNFSQFFYLATKSFKYLSFFLIYKSQPFIKTSKKIKAFVTKIENSKIKFWIDSYFINFQDNYSSNSIILSNYIDSSKKNYTNFF